MRKPLLVGLALAVALVAFAAALPSLRARFQEAEAPDESLPAALPSAGPSASPSGSPTAPPPAVPETLAKAPRELKALGKKQLDAQIAVVVLNMDRTGRPPSGVAQGGRRGSRPGVFQNAERHLPVQAPGYYRESDVWPRRAGVRGPERLVFGREGEVYYSPNHYRAFVRLR